MHKKGMTTYAIAKQLGLSQTGVKYVLDSEYREHMRQISRERSSKPKSPQPNNAIFSSDAAWLSQHKQSIEKKVKTLKRTAVFVFYSVAAYAIFAVLFAIFSIITYLSLSGAALFAVISCFAIGFAGASIPSGFEGEALIGVFLGVIIGLIIAL